MDRRAAEKEEAWVGDAVLGLFAREWIVAHPGIERSLSRHELFSRLTCNQFLSRFGEPTAVEAAIGRRYRRDGLATTFAWLEAEFIPAFVKQLQNRSRGGRRTGA